MDEFIDEYVEINKRLENKNAMIIRVFDEEYVNKIYELDKLYYIDTKRINIEHIDIHFGLFSSPEIKSDVLVITPNFVNNLLPSFIYILELLKFKHVKHVKFIFLGNGIYAVDIKNFSFICNIEDLSSKLENIIYYNFKVNKLYFKISNDVCFKEITETPYSLFKPEYMFILNQLHISSQFSPFQDHSFYMLGDVLEENISIIENTHKMMKLCHDLNLNEDEAKEFLKLL